MTSLTITSKGQVTLRRDLLKHLGVKPGQKIEVEKLPNGKIAVSATKQKGVIVNFIGCLSQKKGPILSIDEINKIAAQGWTGEK